MRVESIEQARQWIKEGNPCMYRMGYSYRGATARPVNTEKAEELLEKHKNDWMLNGEMGFYDLHFEDTEKGKVLMFQEYSLNDLL